MKRLYQSLINKLKYKAIFINHLIVILNLTRIFNPLSKYPYIPNLLSIYMEPMQW